MLSFVVQNYYSNTPVLIRTRRYQSLVKYSMCLISIPYINFMLELSKSLRINILKPSAYLVYFNKNFLKTFWKYFKFFVIRDVGLYTNNFHKSLVFCTIQSLNEKLWFKNYDLPLAKYSFVSDRYYVKPVSVFHFSFNLKVYNTLIFFIFHFITNYYFSSKNDFKLYYNFILFQDNFKFFFFCNIPYFKVFNY